MIEINKIYNEDCLLTMRKMKDDFVDLVITSPPYDNLRKYDGFSFDFESVAHGLFRVVKVGGVVVWVVADSIKNGSESLTSFKQAIFFVESCGFKLHDTMIYLKKSYIPLNHNRYDQAFEYMFCFVKGNLKTFNPLKEKTLTCGTIKNRLRTKIIGEGNGCASRDTGRLTVVKDEKIRSNVWAYAVGLNDKTQHPAPFPENLASDHIVSWSNKGDLVYDPFAGSGTVPKMARLLGRNFIGSEISKKYCEIINNRLAQGVLPL